MRARERTLSVDRVRFLRDMTETEGKEREKLSFRQVLWVAIEGQM